ncbi:MAG: aldehyde dehydrogenase family protein [Pyrinomonadaceae bacterium]
MGIISPWNFPWAIPLGEVVMALMAGNAVDAEAERGWRR